MASPHDGSLAATIAAALVAAFNAKADELGLPTRMPTIILQRPREQRPQRQQQRPVQHQQPQAMRMEHLPKRHGKRAQLHEVKLEPLPQRRRHVGWHTRKASAPVVIEFAKPKATVLATLER